MLEEIDIGDVPMDELVERVRERGIFVFDLETTGLDPLKDKIEGISIYVPDGEKTPPMRAWYPFVDDTMLMYVQPDETTEEQHARIKFDRTSDPEDKVVWERLRQKPVIQNLRPALVQREVMEKLRPVFEDDPELTGIAHNAKFDVGFLIHSSGADRGIAMNMKLADSMLLDFLGDENQYAYGLKQRVKELFGHEMVTYEDAARLKRQSVLPFMADVVQPLGIYAMEDVYWTWKLYELCLDRIQTEDESGRLERIFWNIDMRIARILNEMECGGVLIDWRWLREVSKNLEKEKDEILTRIENRVGYTLNPKSSIQVSELLFGSPEQGGLGLSTKAVKQGASGLYSTGSKEINHLRRVGEVKDEKGKILQHSLVADILDFRSLETVRANFADKIGRLAQEAHDGRVHSHFNQTGTVIFRLSSSDPFNFQNQPRDRNLIRKAFCAHQPDEPEMVRRIIDAAERKIREDELMLLFGADYSQIELRVAAHLSGDKNMIEVYSSVGGCHVEEGNPCLRYQHWVCDDCDKKDKTKDRVESVYLPIVQPGMAPEKKCPRCGGPKVKHQKRCRHVDLHQRTSEDVNVERDPLSKNLNFGNLYRIGPDRFCQYADLYDENGDPRVEYAESVIEGWHGAYPGIKPFHIATEKHLRDNKWVAMTLTGRRRRLHQARYIEGEYRAITQGIQFQVSGSAQDIIKIAMIRIIEERDKKIATVGPAEKKLWRKTKLLIQVHDELVGECPAVLKPEIKEMVDRNMKGAASLRVPLDAGCKFGQNWDDIH